MSEYVKCPVCEGVKFTELIDFGVIPSSWNLLQAPETPCCQASHKFEFCSTCALIRRIIGNSEIPNYQEIDRCTAPQMPTYVPTIIDQLCARLPNKDVFIADIGGNDGAFLGMVAQKGYRRLLNVEPSSRLALASAESGCLVENVHFNASEAQRIATRHGQAGAIFCRHVLEHVPDPLEVLAGIRQLLSDDGWLFLEVPNAREIIHGMFGHWLWDEHLFYFTSVNLATLLAKSGFHIETITLKPHRGGTNIWVWAHPAIPSRAPVAADLAHDDLRACKVFGDRWESLKRKTLAQSRTWSKPVACLGASHPQSNFIKFLGLGDFISYLVDDDPLKIGRFVPAPRPIPVISTRQLLDGPPPGTVVRSAFGCLDWMDRICTKLMARGTRVVEPYSEGDCLCQGEAAGNRNGKEAMFS